MAKLAGPQACALVGLGVALSWGFQATMIAQAGEAKSADTVRAKRVEVVDDEGNVAVVICADASGAAGLYVPNERNPRVAVGVKPDGSALVTVLGANGGAIGSLWINAKEGYPALTLGGPKGDAIVASSAEWVGLSAVLKNSNISAAITCLPAAGVAGASVTDARGRVHGIATDGDAIVPAR